MTRIAVIGVGYWGRNLVRNFSGLGVLAGVCEPGEEARNLVREQYPDVAVDDQPERVFADAEIDGVVIATPAEMHGALARQALEAGKHVFVEKPLAITREQLRAAGRLVRWDSSMKAVWFLSHQWTAFDHPDPSAKTTMPLRLPPQGQTLTVVT